MRCFRMSPRTVIGGFIIVFLAIRIAKEPVPADTSEPLKLKVLLAGYRFVFYLGHLSELLGVCSAVTTRRFFTDSLGGLLMRGYEGVKTEDAVFDGVKVRLYIPEGKTESAPGVIYYHGGGFVIGSIDSHNSVTSFMAKEVNAVVVSVEYRLCPEHSLLDGIEDAVKATKYFMTNADKFGVDPRRIAVAGDSAGGHLATIVSLKLRKFSIQPRLQVLIYPVVQMIDLDLPSQQQHPNDVSVLERGAMTWMLSNAIVQDSSIMTNMMKNAFVLSDVRFQYANGRLNHDLIPKKLKHEPYSPSKYPQYLEPNVWERVKDKILKPEYSPLLATSHKGLPEAYIYIAMNDPIRDDGILYKHRLTEDGVKVTHYIDPKGWHGMVNFVKDVNDATNAMHNITDFMKSKLQ